MDRLDVLEADVRGATRELGRAKRDGEHSYADTLRARRSDLLQEILAESGKRGYILRDGTVAYTTRRHPVSASAKLALFGPAYRG